MAFINLYSPLEYTVFTGSKQTFTKIMKRSETAGSDVELPNLPWVSPGTLKQDKKLLSSVS